MKIFCDFKAVTLPILLGISAFILSACTFGQTSSRYSGEYVYQNADHTQVNASRYGSHDFRQSCVTAMIGCPGAYYYQAPLTYAQVVETQISNLPSIPSTPSVTVPETTITTPPPPSISTPIDCPFGTIPQSDGSCLTTDIPPIPPVLSAPRPTVPSTYSPPDYVYSDYNPVRK